MSIKKRLRPTALVVAVTAMLMAPLVGADENAPVNQPVPPTQIPAPMPMDQSGMMPGMDGMTGAPQAGPNGMWVNPQAGPGPGCMGMRNMQMSTQNREQMQQHMAAMETHLANIEALLKELLAIQKTK